MRYLALTCLLWLYCEVAHAQAQEPVIPPGDDRIEHVVAGSRAPYDGMLLDTDTAIRWTNRITWLRETLRLRTEEHSRILAAIQASALRDQQILEQSYTRQIEALRQDLRDAVTRYERELLRHRDPPFYETWGFAFGVGVLVTGIIVGVVAGLVAGI